MVCKSGMNDMAKYFSVETPHNWHDKGEKQVKKLSNEGK